MIKYLMLLKLSEQQQNFVDDYLLYSNAYKAASLTGFVLRECTRINVRGYYVYAIINPANGEIVHIGKGIRDRWRTCRYSGSKLKVKRIKEIRANGNKPDAVYLAVKLSSYEAHSLERLFAEPIFGASCMCSKHKDYKAYLSLQ